MSYVVDSSLALSWCFPDEYSAVTSAAYRLAEHGSLVVPTLWHVEVANVLGLAFKRNRIDLDMLDRAFRILGRFEIETADAAISQNAFLILRSMNESGLTAYDPLYVEFAKQLHLPLETLDRHMALAAKAAGVTLIVEPQ